MQNANSLSGLSSLDARTIPLRTIKYYRHIRLTGTTASFLLFLLTTLMAFPFAPKSSNIAEAAPAEDPEPKIAMVMEHGQASVDLLVSSPSGTFAYSDADEIAAFNVTTSNYTGYTLSISAQDDNGQLTNEATGTSFNSIDSVISETTFDNDVYNGKWGYVPSKYGSIENTSFRPAPTTSASTLDVTNRANVESNNYTIALGARADIATSAGTYSDTFILTAVGNPVPYSITYADDTGDSTVANLPSFGGDSTNHVQTGSVSASSITLSDTIPTRNGYTFLSWCLGATSNNGTVCTGTTYTSGGEFAIDHTASTKATLNAVWSPNITIKTSTGISSVTLNSASTTTTSGIVVTNLRYGQSYTISATAATGYSFNAWPTLSGTSGSIASVSSSSTTYTVGSVPVTITPTSTANKYDITLNNDKATTSGSTSAYATYNSSNVYAGSAEASGTSTITAPQRKYTVSGFDTSYNNASGATVSSTASLTSSYTFNGWYTATSGGTRIITDAGALVASTTYTNASAQWTSTSTPTLYAQWGSGTAITLPTISKTGHTCGWTTGTSTSTITYASGYSGLVPTANMTLHGVCTANKYDITIKTSTGVSKVKLNGVECDSSDGCVVSNLISGQSYNLEAELAYGYEFVSWDAGENGTIASPTSSKTTYTIGSGNSTIVPTTKLAEHNITIYFNGSGVKNVQLCSAVYSLPTGSGMVYTCKNSQGTISVSGGSISLPYVHVYYLFPTFLDGYEFSSWQGSSNVSFIGSGAMPAFSTTDDQDVTLTLTAKLSCQNSISGTMQAFNPSNLCSSVTSGTLTDSRDNQSYTVAKINGQWWMTKNLAIGCNGSASSFGNSIISRNLNSSNSNISSSWSTPTTKLTADTNYNLNDARMLCDSTYGAWYNYAAASAGTISGNPNTTDARYSICPYSWRLPTKTNIEDLINNSNVESFNPVVGGIYSNASHSGIDSRGVWMSSTTYAVNEEYWGEPFRYTLNYDTNSGTLRQSYGNRANGYYIRCVRS